MKKIIIFGNSVMAKIAYFYFSRDSKREVLGFTVDSSYNLNKKMFCGLPVFDFETIEASHPPNQHDLFVAIGPTRMNGVRQKKCNEARVKGYSLASYISPNATCDSLPGENSFISDRAVINPFCQLGDNIYIFEGVVISNNSIVGSHNYISPNASIGTYSVIHDNCIIGSGSVIKTSVIVSPKTLVGACTFISRNTIEKGVYAQKNADYLGPLSEKINISIGLG